MVWETLCRSKRAWGTGKTGSFLGNRKIHNSTWSQIHSEPKVSLWPMFDLEGNCRRIFIKEKFPDIGCQEPKNTWLPHMWLPPTAISVHTLKNLILINTNLILRNKKKWL